MLSDGTVFHDGKLYVPWRTATSTGLAEIVADGAGYRIALEGGLAGPAVVRQPGGQWELADGPDNYASGSVLAHLVADKVTANPRTLQHAAGIVAGMKLRESELFERALTPIPPGFRQNVHATVLLAVGQAFIETLPARLRDPEANTWTPHEIRILGPDLARQMGRPLAVYRRDGALDFAVQIDGTPIAPDVMPADTVRLAYDDANRYGRVGRPFGEYASIFAAVEAELRPRNDFRAVDERHREQVFRADLAAAIERTPGRPRLERMFQGWVDPLPVIDLHKRLLKRFSRLRQALLDRNQPLTAEEERLLLTATQDLMPADRRIAIEVAQHHTGHPGKRLALIRTDSPTVEQIVIEADLDREGRRVAYYRRGAAENDAIPSRPITDNSFSPIVDVLLNAGDGKVRAALGLGEWDFRQFTDKLLARIVENDDSLLPASLGRLVVTDPAVLSDAEGQTADSWMRNDRLYVRLRNLDGRTQIVETHAPKRDGTRLVLGYDNELPGRDNPLHFVIERRGKWYPSALLRSGFDPLSASFRQDAAATIVANLPAHTRLETDAARRIADAIPYPILVSFMSHPRAIEIAARGEIVLLISNPTPKRYRTRIDLSGRPLSEDPRATVPPPVPIVHPDWLQAFTPAPRLRGAGTEPVSAQDIATFDSLVASGAPIGEFITRGVGNRHIQALANARRLRMMLREDDYMVLVGTAAGHSFTLALPVGAASIRLTGEGSAAGVPIGDLPAGTHIFDDWFGIAATAADYPARARAVAGQWERDAQQVEASAAEGISILSSPSAFTERMLSSAVQFNLWSPPRDPINETRYLNYMHRRYAGLRETVHAGLDWLDSPAARSEYSRYFPDDAAAQSAVANAGELLRSTLEAPP